MGYMAHRCFTPSKSLWCHWGHRAGSYHPWVCLHVPGTSLELSQARGEKPMDEWHCGRICWDKNCRDLFGHGLSLLSRWRIIKVWLQIFQTGRASFSSLDRLLLKDWPMGGHGVWLTADELVSFCGFWSFWSTKYTEVCLGFLTKSTTPWSISKHLTLSHWHVLYL